MSEALNIARQLVKEGRGYGTWENLLAEALIDLDAAFREAKSLLTPGRERGGLKSDGDPDTWRLARAQWHYDYGNRSLAERELKDINAYRASRDWDQPGLFPPMVLHRFDTERRPRGRSDFPKELAVSPSEQKEET